MALSNHEVRVGCDDLVEVVGLVVIGRNEGDRLLRCLRSVTSTGSRIVYVDSGSTDGSAERARDLDVQVVELNPSLAYTAARARNAGYELLMERWPAVELVQFLDGDTELLPGWLEAAAAQLKAHPDVGVVCGQLQEYDPEASAYSRLAAIEWEGMAGETHAAGGNAMIRADVFREVGGFSAQMIAGEDPELCVRIRRAGYRIVRLAEPMGVHDSGIIRFGQWWCRAIRDGHAYSEILYLQGLAAEPHWKRRFASIVLWGGVIPLLSLLAAWPTSGGSLALLAAIGALWIRIYRDRRTRGTRRSVAALYASHCVFRKSAEFLGVVLFAWNHLVRRRATRLIEHKS